MATQSSSIQPAARRDKAGNGKKGMKGRTPDRGANVAGKHMASMGPVRLPQRDSLDRSQLLVALTALKKGDFSARLPVDWEGLDGKIADTFNDVIELNEKMAKELERLSRVVGKEGKLRNALQSEK